MSKEGLRNPLGVAQVVTGLVGELTALGLIVTMSEDLTSLISVKQQRRNEAISPFFDPAVNVVSGRRFFWMLLTDAKAQAVGLQAFRIDNVDSCLADWGPSYTIGLYMRRQEMLVPLHASPPRGSIAERISGLLVYHGELWVDRMLRNRRIVEIFGRLGMLLSLVRWNPDAIWALASHSMATRGHLNSMGYSYLERGYFRWQWNSDGIDPVEWVAITERAGLEQMVEEILTTPQKSRLA
jgi:hypothetical protein